MSSFFKAALFAAVAFTLAFTPLVAAKKTASGNDFPVETEKYEKVLSLWHLDTFEGGTGSRADFLTDAAIAFGKTAEGRGTHFLVSYHTVESLEKSLSNGDRPSVVSYGVGAGAVGSIVRSVPAISFSGANVGKECYGYPWCVGGYFLIKKTEGETPQGKLIVSQGAYNLPAAAMRISGISGEGAKFAEPMNAYTGYLGNSSAVLLGTQRDIKRLEGRGAAFFAEPLSGFSDLVQYISVTAEDEEEYKICLAFAEYLLSEKVQKGLTKIGMMSAFFGIYEDGPLSLYDFSENEYTVSPFTDRESLSALQTEAAEGDGESERLKNALKHLS